ncbi:hypothetical protein HMPREF3230_01078 [Gardnerella vaginalis]|uniref:Uncharacterized protein n=1 Tax=Gardnerella vaginalis TaxID=2702 RepID=A0A135Z4B7_GARVA|nr:hypothetical protein HMPREF3230_01078 [Gardnerella vaginalis]
MTLSFCLIVPFTTWIVNLCWVCSIVAECSFPWNFNGFIKIFPIAPCFEHDISAIAPT